MRSSTADAVGYPKQWLHSEAHCKARKLTVFLFSLGARCSVPSRTPPPHTPNTPPRKEAQPTSVRRDSSVCRLVAATGNNVTLLAVKDHSG